MSKNISRFAFKYILQGKLIDIDQSSVLRQNEHFFKRVHLFHRAFAIYILATLRIFG